MAKKRQAKKTVKKSTTTEEPIPKRPDRDQRVRQAERLPGGSSNSEQATLMTAGGTKLPGPSRSLGSS